MQNQGGLPWQGFVVLPGGFPDSKELPCMTSSAVHEKGAMEQYPPGRLLWAR